MPIAPALLLESTAADVPVGVMVPPELPHVPPTVTSLNVAGIPAQILFTPVMGAGCGLTVKAVAAAHSPPPKE